MQTESIDPDVLSRVIPAGPRLKEALGRSSDPLERYVLGRAVSRWKCGAYRLSWSEGADEALEPTRASGVILVTGSPQGVLRKNVRWRTRDGLQFINPEAVPLRGGQAEVPVVATRLGPIGNLAAGKPLWLHERAWRVDPWAMVGLGGLTGGRDAVPERETLVVIRIGVRGTGEFMVRAPIGSIGDPLWGQAQIEAA